MTGLNILSPRLKAGWAWDSTHSARGVGGAGGTPSHPGSRLPCDPNRGFRCGRHPGDGAGRTRGATRLREWRGMGRRA